MATIIRKLEARECREQPGKAAPVRPIVGAAATILHSLMSRLRGREPAMNVTLKPFDFAQAVARAGLAPNGQPLAAAARRSKAAGFQQALGQGARRREQVTERRDAMQREVQLDNPTVSLEQTMVAMQKAQIGFQATLQVRNRLVQAYSDIMNMQV